MVDRCVICGEPVPEGRQVCPICIERTVGEQPDMVAVVRCRDCKHFTTGMAVGMCKRNPNKPILPIPYNHFCFYGERRTNNG